MGGELIYILRSVFLVEIDQTNDEKYIYVTFLWFDRPLEALRSLVIALDIGEFPYRGELIYVLHPVFLVVSHGTNDEKEVHSIPE